MLPPLIPTVAVFAQVAASLGLLGCSERMHGETSFKEQSRRFEGELSPEERKSAIRQLQNETSGSKP
jgi:hypothetical protein